MQLLVEAFQYNTLAIDFWLMTSVLPRDTRQYPENLKVTSWHLAARSDTSKVRLCPENDWPWMWWTTWTRIIFRPREMFCI
jgi:hypothetical protein